MEEPERDYAAIASVQTQAGFALYKIEELRTPKPKFFPSRASRILRSTSRKDHPYMVSALQGWRFAPANRRRETERSRGFTRTRIANQNAGGRERGSRLQPRCGLACGDFTLKTAEDAKARNAYEKALALSKRDPDIEKSA